MDDYEGKIIITSFTDPVCTWCWGTEPIIRKLETHFPGQIEFRYVMGGLVEDARKMYDPANGIGSSNVKELNRQVASHWIEASRRHGMPVDAEHFDLLSDEYPSSYPQNIAYKAAQMSDPEKADLYLYNLRAAAAAEARLISHEDVQVSIASESGLDVGAFLRHLNDGSAAQAFNGDRNSMAGLGVHGFPTFLVKYNSTQYMLRGYNSYETFTAVIDSATHGMIKPVKVDATEENLILLMERHPRMAAEEVRQTFDLSSIGDVQKFITPMLDAGKLELQRAGNGWFVKRAAPSIYCDIATGVCS